MAGAKFEDVPDFIQAHFEEAPRLDNLAVAGRWVPRHPRLERDETGSRRRLAWRAAKYTTARARTWPGRVLKGARQSLADGFPAEGTARNMPARWRALKRLAIQGHDTDRELEFHARELRSQRFAGEWPLPLAFWQGKAWGGFFRFWFGMLYGFFSDFGRSLARPLLFWLAAIAIGSVYYLGQSQSAAEFRRIAVANGYASEIGAYVRAAGSAWVRPAPCFAGERTKVVDGRPVVTFSGLTETAWESTDATAEAINLAWHNAFILLDSGGDAAYRTYGCLYGIERYGDNPVAFVPSDVTRAGAIQKFFSGAMIFLFGLALRNMLKMK